jgi:hypothetical protein
MKARDGLKGMPPMRLETSWMHHAPTSRALKRSRVICDELSRDRRAQQCIHDPTNKINEMKAKVMLFSMIGAEQPPVVNHI